MMIKLTIIGRILIILIKIIKMNGSSTFPIRAIASKPAMIVDKALQADRNKLKLKEDLGAKILGFSIYS